MVVDPLGEVADLQVAIDALELDEANLMVAVMNLMTKKISSMTLQQVTFKMQNTLLMAASRKSKIDDTVAKLNNPMSIRSVKQNYKVLYLLQDLLTVFKPDGHLLVPGSLEDMSDLAVAAVQILEENVRILLRDNEVHQVAKESHLGWNIITFLNEEEVDEEEKDSARIIKSKDVVAAEKSFMSFSIDWQKMANHKSGGRGGEGGGRGGRGGRGGHGGKGRGGKCLNGVAAGSEVGKASERRNGGCHRCGGPHFVRKCTVPL